MTGLSIKEVAENKDISEEDETNFPPTVQLSKVEKLAKAVKNMEHEIQQEKNLKIPAINLIIRIQSALDECILFPENNNVDILDIISMILDKSAVAWKEKLDGCTKISSNETKALVQSMTEESVPKEQERRRKAKDVWVKQKCVEIPQNASKMYDYTAKTAAGLADHAGMCDNGEDFKEMMKVVVGLPSMIQQQVETKIKEAKERKKERQNRMEPMVMKNMDQLMIATILSQFKEAWEDLQFEATKYLTAIFEFWLRKSMFPRRRPNINSIAVKFWCSHTQLQKCLHGYQKPPRAQQTMV